MERAGIFKSVFFSHQSWWTEFELTQFLKIGTNVCGIYLWQKLEHCQSQILLITCLRFSSIEFVFSVFTFRKKNCWHFFWPLPVADARCSWAKPWLMTPAAADWAHTDHTKHFRTADPASCCLQDSNAICSHGEIILCSPRLFFLPISAPDYGNWNPERRSDLSYQWLICNIKFNKHFKVQQI